MAEPSYKSRWVWHELLTSDPEAAKSFYTQVVGWGTAKWGEPMPDAPDYTMFVMGEMPCAGVMQLPKEAADMGAPPHWLAYTGVLDANATAEQVRSLGGSVLMGPMTMPGVGTFAVCSDPQGAVFAVITPESDMGYNDDPQLGQFSWHELATPDPKAALDFYKQLFGWELKQEMDMGPEAGMYYIFGAYDAQYGGVYVKPEQVPVPNWTHYVRVPSADEAAEKTSSLGGQVLVGPMEVPGGDRITVAMDPQGAAFAVHSKAAS